MTVVTVEEAMIALVVIDDYYKPRIQQLIEDAEDECRQFLNRETLPREGAGYPNECDTAIVIDPVSDSSDLPKSLRRGILLIVQGAFEGKDAEEMAKLRKAAEVCWYPYRAGLGV